jgi:hypothetical protein
MQFYQVLSLKITHLKVQYFVFAYLYKVCDLTTKKKVNLG